MIKRGFHRTALAAEEIKELAERARLCRGDILKMTTLASSGHPGGSMSSLEMFILVYGLANIDPADPCMDGRDYVLVSHGHVSPAVYSTLARTGFFNVSDAIAGFRLAGSIFEGHVEHLVPGVEWNTGNLGQGLSAGCGMALAQRLTGHPGARTFVLMSDGEQAKGQVAEARRFAKKFKLDNLTVVIDYNELQISGSIHEVMPQKISDCYRADGWTVFETDGHDFHRLYSALHEAVHTVNPTMVLAKTVMGKDVGFMENEYKYHGAPLKPDLCAKALAELSVEDDMEALKERRAAHKPPPPEAITCPVVVDLAVENGTPAVYPADAKLDNRSAFGNALADVADATKAAGGAPIAVFDCDLAVSVKTDKFAGAHPDRFFQVGVQEHNTGVIAGALSSRGAVAFWADFGVFGIDEAFNQQRLNDINMANIKLACTHVGVDVGEDGKTHQCLDYVGAIRNFFGWRVVVPADPNQTDRAVRAMASAPGCWLVAMGRSKTPIVTDGKGDDPLFGAGYTFEYGKADWLREGSDVVLVTMGAMTPRALKAHELLAKAGVSAAVLNVSCPLHLDETALGKAAATKLWVSYEDHNVNTGLGSCLADFIVAKGLPVRLVKMGVDRYAGSGKPDALFAQLGLASEDVADRVKETLGR